MSERKSFDILVRNARVGLKCILPERFCRDQEVAHADVALPAGVEVKA